MVIMKSYDMQNILEDCMKKFETILFSSNSHDWVFYYDVFDYSNPIFNIRIIRKTILDSLK